MNPFLARLWPATKAMVRAFYAPRLGLEVPASVLTGLLVFGVFLVAAGMVMAASGKGKLWTAAAVAAGLALAGWALAGGRHEVTTFFVVVMLILAFLGGMTFLVGLLRTPWIPLGLALCILLAATGLVDARWLAAGLSVAASFLGAWSLLGKFESLSPGRKGSRWNRRTAVGWVLCLLVSGTLEAPGLASYAGDFKVAGMVVGAGLLLMMPRTARRAA